jgi:outer membrane lipoprotein-sorting protein
MIQTMIRTTIRKSPAMMPRRTLAPFAVGIVLAAGSAAPVAAQNPFDFLFNRNPAPSAPPRAPAAAPAQPAAKPAPAPKRPAAVMEDPATTQALGGQGSAKTAAPAAAPPSGMRPVATAATPAAAPAPAAPLGEKQIVERANAYFNAITSLVGDFVQVGGDGRKLSGKIYLQRPGKIRFEYDAPATLEVIADGSSVAVRDRKLATQDLYSIGQTPLKFLLRERIELGRDLKITEVAPENDAVRIALEDKSTLGGTSKITLYFDKDVNDLTRWRILDPQGFQTMVSLANLERNARVDQKLFTIDYQRILNDRQ